MIHFNSETKSFLLSAKNYGYAMFVNSAGFLQQLHFGKKIAEGDLPFFIAQADSPDPQDFNIDEGKYHSVS